MHIFQKCNFWKTGTGFDHEAVWTTIYRQITMEYQFQKSTQQEQLKWLGLVMTMELSEQLHQDHDKAQVILLEVKLSNCVTYPGFIYDKVWNQPFISISPRPQNSDGL